MATSLTNKKREQFTSGAVRDSQEGKPRYGLIPIGPLRRLAMRYTDGAKAYGEDNYQKGIPFSRVADSLLRHIYSYLDGDSSEDHLAAVAWNAFALMFYEEQIIKGKLPSILNDLTDN